jgi:hypothetical protein
MRLRQLRGKIRGGMKIHTEIDKSTRAAIYWIERRRARPEDDDGHLTEYHRALAVHLAGVVWNSFDPDPRANNPLDADEIAAWHRGAP